MSNTTLFVPRTLNIGFQNASDTFSGKLAYVIYYDEKGKLRKETSWNTWRDLTIPNIICDNTPQEGFVLNKSVGGYCYYWSSFRKPYIRVFDPRGFEVEITLPNLLYILKYSSCVESKLSGSFVYGWEGTELVLVPTSSEDYKELKKLNNSRFDKEHITSKNIVIGGTYLQKDGSKCVYLGKFDYYPFGTLCNGIFFENSRKFCDYLKSIRPAGTNPYDYSFCEYHRCQRKSGQRYFFSALETKSIFSLTSLSSLIETISTEKVANFEERFDLLEQDVSYSPFEPSMNEFVQIPFDEFCDSLNRDKYGIERFGIVDEKLVKVDIRPADNGNFVVQNHGYYTPDHDELNIEMVRFNPKELFKFVPCDSSSSYRRYHSFDEQPKEQMEPVSAEEIYSKIKFVHIKKYLRNGRLYEDIYV